MQQESTAEIVVGNTFSYVSVHVTEPIKPYVCSKHGLRYADLVFQKGNYEDEWDAFCGECIRLKFLELGLEPMQKVNEP